MSKPQNSPPRSSGSEADFDDRFGVYIHFPWCRNRCPYCDFAIAVSDAPPHREYLAAIQAELRHYAPLFAGKRLVSIYFGGGTPSLWAVECLAELIDDVCGRFEVERDALEINIESNPTDCEPTRLRAWQDAGVNRLLIGVQATQGEELVTLGRDHRMGDGRRALEGALGAGFARLGADLILGVPGTIDPLASLRDLAGLRPPHLSVYELTVEERTPLAQQVARGELVPVGEDQMAELYEAAHHELCARGYEHYEVSSYALPGQRAVHNSLYWQGASYLGLGNGAASLLTHPDGRARRWQNRRSVKGYLLSGGAGAIEELIDSVDEIAAIAFASEKLWLGMRTIDGVSEAELGAHQDALAPLVAAGLLEAREGRMRPTLKGFLYHNQLIHTLNELGAGAE